VKVKDIQIEGFGVWKGLSVDSMPDSMTVFYGPNEAGKTTLMQFLRAMFYGYTPERKTRYLPPVHGGRPGGAIRVTGPGGGYEISRRARLDDPGISGELTVTGSDGSVQGQHRLAMLLGQVDETIFTNVFAIGLRELQELNTLDDTAAADELYKLSSGLDRVSLVDVIRQLKKGRRQIVGPNNEEGQMQKLILRREKLRDELEELNGKNIRWGELAAQRRSHQLEIEDLRKRTEQWELESKTAETAMHVREPWAARQELQDQIDALSARTDLADNADTRLEEILAKIAEKENLLGELRGKRRTIRERARKLPVRKSILDVAAKIEAASEQTPWISTLQKQIQRLESDVQTTRDEVVEDANKLGLTEEDQLALLHDKRLNNIPDLSRTAISELSEPARAVRENSVKLKQAKSEGANDKKEADRLSEELSTFLKSHDQDDLHVAIQKKNEFIAKLRSQEQLEERLGKLQRHKREMESEAVGLASDEALPIERAMVLAIPFVFGGCLFFGGLAKIGGYWFTQDKNTGMMMLLIGFVCLFFYWSWRSFIERSSNTDLDDCEDQLESLVKQLKKVEHERDEMQRSLPTYAGTLEQRLRESEHELVQFEKLLPVYHNQQAALQRYQAARKRGTTAASDLKSARAKWKRNLQHLGLAESLSPKSLRILADGYDSLLQSRSRLKNHEDQLAQRKLELETISQRVEQLAQQVSIAIRDDGDESEMADELSRPAVHRANREKQPMHLVRTDTADGSEMHVTNLSPVKRLQELNGLLAQQQTYIQQRRDLKDEDEQLAKQQKSVERSIEKLRVAENAALKEFGVETLEQLTDQLAKKRSHEQLTGSIAKQDEQVKAIIGGAVPYETVATMLHHSPGSELEKRLETLQQRVIQSEERISQLLQRQGETTQEMKTLAADYRLSEVKLEIACLEKQLQACSHHWQTLAATTQMLEKVCEVYETERQPETLREASSFLTQLTEGKYVRVWTPLGKNALRIDNSNGQSLPLEVLSRGTREAVFIALRLSLAAAYSRRGIVLPLVMDDVLVNFDAHRARCAARVLRDFSMLGNQVIMFTCHEHIMRMLDDIGVQVRVLPNQGKSGEAHIFVPDSSYERPRFEQDREEESSFEEEPVEAEFDEPDVEEEVAEEEPVSEEILEEEVAEESDDAVEEEPADEGIAAEETVDDEPAEEQAAEEESAEEIVEDEPEVAVPVIREVKPVKRKKIPKKKPRSQPRPRVVSEPIEDSFVTIDHLWYELGPNEFTQAAEHPSALIDYDERVNEAFDQVSPPVPRPADLWWQGSSS
jgi:uncharacterized protein YhaN